MRLIIALVLVSAAIVVSGAEETETNAPPLKIDKHLRRALLKALEDLEAESIEKSDSASIAEKLADELASQSSESGTSSAKSIDRFKGASITFDQFNNDSEEVPGEDKLQNSTFIETDKYVADDSSVPSAPEMSKSDQRVVFQKYDVLLGDKAPIEKFSESLQAEPDEPRRAKTSKSSASVNAIEGSSKSTSQERESLAISSSNGIVSASANALSSPSPTVQSPTARTVNTKNITTSFIPTASSPTATEPKKSEVNIFKAPLVAAFTVQQDESGVAKSVVPIYKSNGNGQTLTLQEQLEFKQQLLERQLAELQAQQIQQTQFLIRQQQLYQEQQRNKQRQNYFLQEQARLKQLEEQRILQKQQQQQQQRQLQQQQQQQQQLLQQQQQQQLQNQLQHHQQQQNQLHQQLPLQQPLGAFTQNNLLALQLPSKSSHVQFQHSIPFQVPNVDTPPPFQPNNQEQLRLQHQRQHLINQQQIQHQQQQQLLHRQQLLQQEQRLQQEKRLQQSFSTFPIEFQPPVASSPPRFHRQEAFTAIGNAGINNNDQLSKNQSPLDVPRAPIQSFAPFNQFNQFSPIRHQPQRPPTPANQIQHLLFQSGIAKDLGNNPGSGNNQEDLNIVSKVLALNVGALPITHNLKYTNNGFGRA